MADPSTSPPPQRRSPTVEAGRGGWGDPRREAAGLLVEGGGSWRRLFAPKPRSLSSVAPATKTPASKPEPQRVTPLAAPALQTTPRPSLAASAVHGGGGLNALYVRYSVPIAILMFALATQSVFLSIIFLVLWLQRAKLLGQTQLPWEDPSKIRPFIETFQTRTAASAKGIDGILRQVLADPPYNDAAAFKDWVRVRLASAVSLVFGGFLVLRLIGMLLDRLTQAGGGGGTSI